MTIVQSSAGASTPTMRKSVAPTAKPGPGEITHLTVVLDTVQGAVSGVVTAFDEMGAGPALFDLSCALLLVLDHPKVLAPGASGVSMLASAVASPSPWSP